MYEKTSKEFFKEKKISLSEYNLYAVGMKLKKKFPYRTLDNIKLQRWENLLIFRSYFIAPIFIRYDENPFATIWIQV